MRSLIVRPPFLAISACGLIHRDGTCAAIDAVRTSILRNSQWRVNRCDRRRGARSHGGTHGSAEGILVHYDLGQ